MVRTRKIVAAPSAKHNNRTLASPTVMRLRIVHVFIFYINSDLNAIFVPRVAGRDPRLPATVA
jgi:hypothetical protein